MEANSTQDSSSGSSMPIRAPLTVDSDSEFNLSVNGHNYSRTNSFSSSSSIDLSSYEQDDESFVTYPDDEIGIKRSNAEEITVTRAFVKYPDGNCVKESSSSSSSSSFDKNEIFRLFEKYPDEDCVKESGGFDKNVIFRPFVKYPDGDYVKERSDLDKNVVFKPFVKYPCEESSSGDFGMKLGLDVPVAHLTSDCDSDIDAESVDGLKWLVSDGIVQKVGMAPKARIYSGDEGDDEGDDELHAAGVFSGDDVNGIEELKSVLAESIEGEGCRYECLDEVAESNELSVDFKKIDAHIVSCSNSEIEIKTINMKLPESDKLICELERTDAQNVSVSDNEIEIKTINTKLPESDKLICELERTDAPNVSVSDNEIEIKTIGVKLPESDELSCDLERIDSQNVSSSDNEIETETFNVELSELDELSFQEKADSQIISHSINEIEIETINVTFPESDDLSHGEKVDPQIVDDSNNEIEIETMNAKLSELDESSFDLEKFDAHISPYSENEIVLETNENRQEAVFNCYRNESKKRLSEEEEEEETQVKLLTREKFLRCALGEQLTTKVNGKDEFDFHLTILVIGKTGAGKSATINSIFGKTKTSTNAFNSGTTTTQEIIGKVDGIRLRVLDTPGLKCSPSERSYNLRILKSIKRFTQKHTPDVVLFVDRLDTYAQDENDSQLLMLITSSLGSSVWRNCIIVLTHAASNLPDESSEVFVFQRCSFVQKQIVNISGINRHMANPVWLVENHPSYQQDKSKLFKFSGLDGLICFDRANEDGSDSLEAIKGNVERKRAYFKDHGYRVKLVGNKHWSIACRLYS